MIIDAISNGIVIDHITAGKAMYLYKVLDLDKLDCSVALLKNVVSNKLGRKDIIKIDQEIPLDLDLLGYIDPGISVNIIRDGKLVEKKKGRKYYMDLGQISHYLADYFTYPHNKIYPGSLKDHCSYEEKLKRDLRRYIRTDAAKPHKADHLEFKNAKNLCDFIQKSHDDYLVRKHDVEDDIHHFVEVNYKAMETTIHLLAEKRAEFRLKHS